MDKQQLKVQQELGSEIRAIMEADNISVYAINKKTGLSPSIIKSVLKGDKNYTVSTLTKILRSIGYHAKITKKL
jgi:predicted transcriptional regulator